VKSTVYINYNIYYLYNNQVKFLAALDLGLIDLTF